MLDKILIENFRSWSERTEFELKPLTLLYGPNSAGKSSIFHAIALFRQTMENANGAEIPLISIGKYTNLGDFTNLVSFHDTDRFIKIGFSFIAKPDHAVLIGKNHEWRVLIEIRYTESRASKGELSRFSVEIGDDVLTFEAVANGYRLHPTSHIFFSRLLLDELAETFDVSVK